MTQRRFVIGMLVVATVVILPRTLQAQRRDLVEGLLRGVLDAQMRVNNAADPTVRQFVIDAAEDFFAKPDDERGSVLSNS